MIPNMLYILLGVIVGWVCSLSSGVVIGYIVFKTKRDPYDPMFQFHKPKAEVFNIKEPWEQDSLEPEKTPDEVAKAAERFREQTMTEPEIAKTLGKEKNEST